MGLHLIRRDFGAEVARRLVVPPQRDGGQKQFDAGALAATDVGVAAKGGAAASLAAADVYLSREGLAPQVEVMDGSRRVVSVIRRALAYTSVVSAPSPSPAAFTLAAAPLPCCRACER